MNITILQTDLSKALNTAVRFASTRGTLPILSNFLLKADKARLTIKATNLEMSVSLGVGAKIEEAGETTIPAKLFLDVVSNLRDGQISLVKDKKELKIPSGPFKA